MANISLNRILLVEDDIDIQFIAKMALESVGGFTVQVCSSGQEALDKIPEFKPELILMDVMMPGMDGLTTFRELKKIEEFKSIPVVFLTAKVQTKEIEIYKEIGGIDVILKPFDPMTLTETIQNIWSKYLSLKNTPHL